MKKMKMIAIAALLVVGISSCTDTTYEEIENDTELLEVKSTGDGDGEDTPPQTGG